MRNRHAMFLPACALLLATLLACGQPSSKTAMPPAGAGTGATPASTAIAATPVPTQGTVAGSAAQPTAEVGAAPVGAASETWSDSQAVRVVLNGSSITAQGVGVSVDGSKATITSAGTYVISGSLVDGQIVVDSAGKETVTLVLNGVDIHNSSGSPIAVMDAGDVVIILADHTENYVSDGASYVLEDPESDEPNATIFSKADLTIGGLGSLTVAANYNDGIASKDGLVIASGTISITSVDDGIRGKDYVVIQGGTITIAAQGDGLKADNEDDPARGHISVESGRIQITCGGDAIQAETEVQIADGEFILTCGGGSNSRISEDTSAKGIKAGSKLTVDGGTFTIDSADDALHSNGSLTINAGTFVISTGDDALHADAQLEINGGELTITDSYEGLESSVITINGGALYVTSRDDGINVSAGRDGSGTNLAPGQGGRPGRGGGPGQDNFAYSGNQFLYINGGYVVVNAAGDGLDANGAVEMTDGVVIVHGPTEQRNSALDHVTFKMTGGFLVAAGSSGMAQAPDQSSTQYSVLLNLGGTLQAGSLLHIQSTDGEEILTFAPAKPCQSITFSSPQLGNGVTYRVYYGGSSTGTVKDGLYQDGTYTPGTSLGTFSLSGMVTRLGSGRR